MGQYRESGKRLGGIGGADEGGCCNGTRSCVARHPAAAPEAERGAGEGSCGLAQPCDLITARGLPHGSHAGIGAPVGLEWAGEVVEAGAEAKGYSAGDRVMCSGTGGYAEFAVSDFGRVNPIPDGMSFEQAATLPVALITLHNALVTAGRLHGPDSVMIQGASSGVGLMGLQIAKFRGAGLVIGTSTNAERRSRLKMASVRSLVAA